MRSSARIYQEASLGLVIQQIGLLGLLMAALAWFHPSFVLSAGQKWVLTIGISLPSLALFRRPSWWLGAILLSLILGVGMAMAFRLRSISDGLLLILFTGALGKTLWAGRTYRNIRDLSPSIRAWRSLVKGSRDNPQSSIRFQIGNGWLSRRRVTATRFEGGWCLSIRGAEWSAGVVPAEAIQIQKAPEGGFRCRFEGPSYVKAMDCACSIDQEEFDRYQALNRAFA